MVPSVTSVEVNPLVLTEGQDTVLITATVSDPTGVTGVYALVFDPSLGVIIDGSATMLVRASGTTFNGTYSGTVIFPPDASDGDYQIIVLAANSATFEEDYDTYGINDDTVVTLERHESEPTEPTEPTEPSDTSEKDKCCCNVTINVSAGPVNIYVCGSENKSQTDVPE